MASQAATGTCEYFVVHYDQLMYLDSDEADCLRLFPSRDDAEVAAEHSANEAMRRYWWGTSFEDDPCTVNINEQGKRAFVSRAEQHVSTFALRKMTASVVDDGGKGDPCHAYGIVANGLLGGSGAMEFTSTVDHGCVFVGTNKDAVKASAINRARAFANELTTQDVDWFSSWAAGHEGDLLVVKEEEEYNRNSQPRQEGGDACLTLRIVTELNPDYDYDEDGIDTSDYFPCTCSTIKVVELPVGCPEEREYECKEFFKEWTKFPRAATPEMEIWLQRRREETRRQLEEAIERERQDDDSVEMADWKVQYLEELRREEEAELAGGVNQMNVNEESANNAQDGC